MNGKNGDRKPSFIKPHSDDGLMKKMTLIAVAVIVVAVILVAAAAAVVLLDKDGRITYHDTRETLSIHAENSDTVADCMFEQTGFEFVSWNTKADGTGDTYMPGDVVDPGENGLDLYTVWVPCVFDYRLGTGTDPATVDGLIHLVYSDGSSAELAQGALMWNDPRVVVSDEVWTWEAGDGNSDFVGTDAAGNRCDLTVTIACGDNDVQKSIVDGEPTYTFVVQGGTAVVVSATVTPAGTSA